MVDPTVGDLTATITRLVRALRRVAPEAPEIAQAVDYIQRKGLMSPLRSGPRADCDQCNGTGEVFEHAEDCDDDLCALNGDEHSCVGQVVECSCMSAAAVMAAEVPKREELTDAQIERGWRDTFSTENPFCPCTLKTFTKAVRWAERAAAPAQGKAGV